MKAYVFDIETDGLYGTKIHCLVFSDGETITSLTSYDDIRNFLLSSDVLIGHNIQRFDIPTLERLLKIQVKAKLVDTLALSWYLEPSRVLHGLEAWGEDFGVPKPKIDDWSNLSVDEYIHRCTEDVKINSKLWTKFRKKLIRLYGTWEEAQKFLEYMEFKMDCAREQERSQWKLDKEYALKSLQMLQETKEQKLATLAAAMPSLPRMAKRQRPAKPFKKDGTLSTTGTRWFKLLRDHNLPKDFDGVIEEVVAYDPPNPGSPVQVKEWLSSMGWKPQTFKFVKEDDGTTRKIPQINLEHGGGLCPSVLKLADSNPAVSLLDALGVISHRIGILNGFLAFAGEGTFVQAQVQGLTNTLRFKHKTAVNLPKVGKPYGEEIRGCLIARDGYELCGSDMASLEDRLKQHFIYPYDPDYVNEMNVEGYDPHLSLALLAGAVTQEQVDAYKAGTDKSIKPIRDIYKSGNYACQYGAGPARLALTADIKLKEAERVHKAYWDKNKAIKKVADNQRVKEIDGVMWLLNPISKFWYHLKYEKDKFSTLVQGSASYVFDMWVKTFRAIRPQLTAQFHDEVVLEIKKGNREKCTALLKNSIEQLNNVLQLNRRLDIDVQFGDRYSSIH